MTPSKEFDVELAQEERIISETIRAGSSETEAFRHPTRALPPEDDLEAPPEVVNPQLGDRIGPYLLQDQLGAGVSCFVFRGWDETNGSPVAVKIVNWSNVYDKPAAMRQMRVEAVTLSRVKHPRVVRFIDFGFDPRWPYLVTEFVEGSTLGELIRTGGAMPTEWATYFISQIVDALGAVWRAGLVHRDIKPDNILIGPNGVAKLIDFGLAKAQVLQANSGLTGPEMAGTASYLAPEQAKDASIVDLRADIYSLGVAFYETLTGRLPFEGRNRVQMIFQHINTPPVPPIERLPTVPQIVSDLCVWMLQKNADERPQNYDELRSAFDTVMGS